MDITQTIVQEIVAQCGRRGFVVSGSLAHFHLVAQTLKDPKDGGTGVELTADRIEELVDRSVSHLTKSDCPSLETFKLQASVTTLKQEQLNKRRTSDVQHRAKAQQLVQDVCSKSDPTQVCAEMTLYILHETHLFSSTNDLVQKETMTALESVIPRGSVAPFIAQKVCFAAHDTRAAECDTEDITITLSLPPLHHRPRRSRSSWRSCGELCGEFGCSTRSVKRCVFVTSLFLFITLVDGGGVFLSFFL